jgi:hypothetical protein
VGHGLKIRVAEKASRHRIQQWVHARREELNEGLLAASQSLDTLQVGEILTTSAGGRRCSRAEAAHRVGDQVKVILEGEVPCLEEVHLGVAQVTLKNLARCSPSSAASTSTNASGGSTMSICDLPASSSGPTTRRSFDKSTLRRGWWSGIPSSPYTASSSSSRPMRRKRLSTS